jgi:glycosyltransferase involved in cell wall biosynthesis
VRLFLKIGNLEFQPDLKAHLADLAKADPRITLLTGYLSRQDLWTLMASIDCFVSLHRAEGFGLGMAEAMACGKAVIATPWSGNVDFTRVENALLVDYALVELDRDLGPYRRGQRWAEPDVASAAHAMRRIAESRELRERLGERGRLTVAREISPEALAPLVDTRLRTLYALLRASARRAAPQS